MGGAGVLPAADGGRARRQGWRVVAFAFPAPRRPRDCRRHRRPLRASTDHGSPCSRRWRAEEVERGRCSRQVLDERPARRGGPRRRRGAWRARARGLLDGNIARRDAIATLAAARHRAARPAPLPRRLAGRRRLRLAARAPDEAEWSDIRAGWRLARDLADAGVGQTVVVRRGAVSAVEAIEGTTEAIRRGTALSGPGRGGREGGGATPTTSASTPPAIGPDTLEAAAAGGATAVAIEARPRARPRARGAVARAPTRPASRW